MSSETASRTDVFDTTAHDLVPGDVILGFVAGGRYLPMKGGPLHVGDIIATEHATLQVAAAKPSNRADQCRARRPVTGGRLAQGARLMGPDRERVCPGGPRRRHRRRHGTGGRTANSSGAR